MQNGLDNFYFSRDASQLPLLQLFGTPEKDKKLLHYEGSSDVYDGLDLARDMLDWLDRYLGPVKSR